MFDEVCWTWSSYSGWKVPVKEKENVLDSCLMKFVEPGLRFFGKRCRVLGDNKIHVWTGQKRFTGWTPRNRFLIQSTSVERRFVGCLSCPNRPPHLSHLYDVLSSGKLLCWKKKRLKKIVWSKETIWFWLGVCVWILLWLDRTKVTPPGGSNSDTVESPSLSHTHHQTSKCLDFHQDDYERGLTGDLSSTNRYSLTTLTDRWVIRRSMLFILNR